MKFRISLAAIAVTLAAAAISQAQVIGQPYRLSDKEVERIIRRIENQANTFRKIVDASLDRSRIDGTRREDDINAFIRAFDEQTKRLHDRFNDHKSVATDVEAVLDRASSIDSFMLRQRLNDRAQNAWSALKTSLDDLALAYNVTWRWGGSVDIAPATTTGKPYRLNDTEIEQILHRIEQRSEKFRSSLDRSLDKSRLDGTSREDDINGFIKKFDLEVKRLHDRFDDRKSVAADVQTVLASAAAIDDFMRRHRVADKAQDEWSALRINLDELSVAYGVGWRWQ
jgi:hypothetical protein